MKNSSPWAARFLALDVTDEAARRAAVEAIEARFGAVGILVNNAGYGQYGPIEEISLDDMRRQFETNVFGAMRLAQLVLPAMRRAGKGRIVNVSSVAGRVSVLGGGPYHAAKFALEAIADALRPEVEPFGVDVVNVLPGPIATHFEATLLKTIPELDAEGRPYAAFKRNLARRMHAFLTPGHFGVMTAEHVASVVFKASRGEAAAHALQRRNHSQIWAARPRARARPRRGCDDPARYFEHGRLIPPATALTILADCARVGLFQKRPGVGLAVEQDRSPLQIGDQDAMQIGAPFSVAQTDDLMARAFDLLIHRCSAGSAAVP